MRSARIGLWIWGVALIAWALHAASAELLFGTDQIALMLSPGTHSPVLGLVVGVLFVLSRIVAICLVPALVVVGAAQIVLTRVRRADDSG
jgi:hypothetical protein